MATIVRGKPRPFGPIVNDVSGLAVTWRQVGGEGLCRWKMLMNGMHMAGQWNCVEYVQIEPGAVIGEHVHARTEEIYYIVSGQATLTIDDSDIDVAAGDLITTPIGSAHAIANRSAQDMSFFVMEMFPGEGAAAKPAVVHVPERLAAGGGLRAAEVDLTPYFTGGWRSFRLVEVPAAGRLGAATPADRSGVVHVLDGNAAITVEDRPYRGGPGLSAAIPPGLAWSAENLAGPDPLRLIVTEAAV